MPDLVEHEVRDGCPIAEADARCVGGQGHLQLHRFRPHRIVVVGAVDAECVDPPVDLPFGDPQGGPVVVGGPRLTRYAPVNMAGDQADLAPEGFGVFQGAYGLLGGVHRDQGGDCEAVAVGPVLIGHELVVEPAQGCPCLVVQYLQHGDAHGGVEHGEVDPRLAQPLVVTSGGADRRVVLRTGRHVPRGGEKSAASPLLCRHVVGWPAPAGDGVQRGPATVVPYEVGEDGEELHDVTISVEYRVTQLFSDPRRARGTSCGHGRDLP